MYIIDGHNLIPKLPGGSLREIDDEERLIELLQAFSRTHRRQIEVFFDGAPPGRAGARRMGMVVAHFVEARLSADDAIRRNLEQMKGRARSATVVSSDRQVQANARTLHASVVSSEEFARQLQTALTHQAERFTAGEMRPGRKPGSGAPSMSQHELENWLNVFGIDPAEAELPIEPPLPPPVRKKGKRRKNA
jgi:predicted RNA-binding protein with PIN domain